MKDLLSQIENMNVSKMSSGEGSENRSRHSRESVSQEDMQILEDSQRMFMSQRGREDGGDRQEVEELECSSNKRSL